MEIKGIIATTHMDKHGDKIEKRDIGNISESN